MPYNRKAVGLVISRERLKQGMTQEQLSGLAAISRSHLATLEAGQKVVRCDTLWRIAEALGMLPSRLVRMIEEVDNHEKG